MRIAFDYQTFVRQSYGGISRYFTRLAQGLLSKDQQVEIFAPLHRNRYLSELPPGIVLGRYINRYPPKTVRMILIYNHLRSHFQIARRNPDLVHETYYSKTGSAPRRCPTVLTVYDMIHELFPNEFSKYDKIAEIKHIAIGRADHIICISENTKRDLMRFYEISNSKLSVVHLGFDQFASIENSQKPILSQKPFLFYVGLRDGYKNFTGLLKAVATSKRLLSDFDIIAFGGPKFSSEELKLFSSLGFAENQIQHKNGSDDLLSYYYSSARAFIYPSLYEGFGIPPLEAMAHYCPVISSGTSAMPEIIGNAGAYFDPLNIDNIQNVIECVVYSDSCIEDLTKMGKERLAAFSWDKCVSETLDVYRSTT